MSYPSTSLICTAGSTTRYNRSSQRTRSHVPIGLEQLSLGSSSNADLPIKNQIMRALYNRNHNHQKTTSSKDRKYSNPSSLPILPQPDHQVLHSHNPPGCCLRNIVGHHLISRIPLGRNSIDIGPLLRMTGPGRLIISLTPGIVRITVDDVRIRRSTN